MREDRAAVERAVVLGAAQPALGVVRTQPKQPDADDVRCGRSGGRPTRPGPAAQRRVWRGGGQQLVRRGEQGAVGVHVHHAPVVCKPNTWDLLVRAVKVTRVGVRQRRHLRVVCGRRLLREPEHGVRPSASLVLVATHVSNMDLFVH